ncbi:MAG TPA: transposase [Steroidobacteraceae bacterium]|nr:transposase [Steroidobacteraceae bacterium]
MSSYRPTATRVLRLRVKDKHASWLWGLAREVNTVFNYCNELSVKVFERERRFLSGFDFWPFLKGVTRGDCALHLPVQAVQEIAEEYARRRRQHRKVRLAWRRSRGARRSLGWIPFKVRTIRYRGGQVYFAGRWLSLWDSYGLGDFELRAGNFSEDSRGRWYLNIGVPRAQRVGGERNKPAVGSILDRSVPSLGIDLGLKTFAAFSDEAIPPIEAKRFYRDLQPALARAQRARQRQRTRAIHAKIANRRRDFLHKLSTRLVTGHGALFVGNVNASALAKTRQAKSVLDSGWSAFRTMLLYKCADAGVWFEEVDEAFSTQTCSVCNSRAGPKGRQGLGMRGWQCAVCGAIHDRDVNAAHNILAAGHRRLAEGILVS